MPAEAPTPAPPASPIPPLPPLAASDISARIKRLWTLILLLVVVVASTGAFVGFPVSPSLRDAPVVGWFWRLLPGEGLATAPAFQIHSDDLIWMWRFKNLPRPSLPTRDTEYIKMKYLPGAGTPYDDLSYIHGLDQPALERWVCHFLLKVSGRMPESLPQKDWDYDRDFNWNVTQGNVAPPDSVRLVRVANAAFMILAAACLFLALARAVSPLAGLVGSLYLVFHPSLIDVMWSIGSDPLLWLCMCAALLCWTLFEDSRTGLILVSLLGGLAASAKVNGAFIVVGYAVWLALRRKYLYAVLAAAIGLLTFIICNPIVFSRGIFGVPVMLWEFLHWRTVRSSMIAAHYPAFAEAGRWRVMFYLLGVWWPLLPLLIVSRRLWKLDAPVFWAFTLAVGHLLTVSAPLPRYTIAIQEGLALGLIAAYWPKRPLAWKRLLTFLRPRRQVRR